MVEATTAITVQKKFSRLHAILSDVNWEVQNEKNQVMIIQNHEFGKIGNHVIWAEYGH